MKQDKLKDYVVVPRSIVRDRRDGKLTKSEFDTYIWLRLNGNPYGTTVTSLPDINDDVFDGKLEKNSINKLLLSLKEKRYIHYLSRAGRRGSFHIEFGDWILPNKAIRNIDHLFETQPIRGEVKDGYSNTSEATQSKATPNQSLVDINAQKKSLVSAMSISKSIRSPYTDTNTDIEKETNRRESFSLKENPKSFTPQSHEDERCQEIALKLGEGSMAFILAKKAEYGLRRVEDVFSIFKEEKAKAGERIKNNGAYFNSIFTRPNMQLVT